MQILFNEVQHPILSVYIFTGSKTIFDQKNLTFLAQKF